MSTSRSLVWRTIVAATLGLSAGSARAHDLWIQPSVSVPRSIGEIGETAEPLRSVVTLGLRVGHGDLAVPVAFRPEDVVCFGATTSLDATVSISIRGHDGQDPAGTFEADPGRGERWIVAYQSRPHPIALPGPRFEAYLREEGLDEIIRVRAEAGRSAHPGLERYARCAKTLLSIPAAGGSAGLAGDRADRVDRQRFDRALGLPLELVVLPTPESASPSDPDCNGPIAGRPLTVQLLLRGDPLEGALVRMERTSGSDDIAKLRTERDGCVTFTPRTPGLWMIGSVHMEPSPPKTGARWDSLWASVTLTVLPAPDDVVRIDGRADGPGLDEDATMGTCAVDWLRGTSWR